MKRTDLACAVTLLSVACGDPLVDPQTVIGLRVLGAQLTSSADPSVAHLSPGEAGTLRWLAVAERERNYRALTLLCEARPSSFGVPQCGPRFLEQQHEGSTTEDLAFDFVLPASFSKDQEWLSFVALCEEGSPRWNKHTQRFSCTSGDQPVTAYYQGTSTPNHNPDASDDTLRFNSKPWPAFANPSCETEGLPRLKRDAVATIRLDVKGKDSEPLNDPSYAAATNEALTYTHVATTAGLSRAFSALDPDAQQRHFELELDGDEAWSDAQEQRLGTFYLVVSDGRGGSDWLSRHYCLHK